MFLFTQIYSRGICLIVPLRKLMIYLLFQKPVPFKGVLDHFWYLLGQIEKKTIFKFNNNTKRLKVCKLCFYLPKYPRGISAWSIWILGLRKLTIYLLFKKPLSFKRVLGHFWDWLGQIEKKISLKLVYNTKILKV